MESRGNSPAYPAQGSNFVRSSLNYGPLPSLPTQLFGFISQKQRSFDQDFHVYSLEWTEDWMRFYVDSRLTYTLFLKFNEPFFKRGDFPPIVQNGTDFIATPDPWKSGTLNVAPFDQPFYLILDLAVGGTSGWFPDGVGGKPWYDGSNSAMREFAEAQSTWYSSWPSSTDDRSFRM